MSFHIPLADCLISLEFRDAKSLREVALRLEVDPSALLRKVQRIAAEHGLLEKIQGRWVLTPKGHLVNRWTEDTIISQQKLLETKSQIRLGSSMWLSEQVIVPYAGCLDRETQKKYNWLIQTPRRNFEIELLEGSCDFIITCGAPVDPQIAYKKVVPEDWVAIAPKAWTKDLKNLKGDALLKNLEERNFVRHIDFNAEDFINLNGRFSEVTLTVDNLIGVRAAVVCGYGWSIVPKLAVLKELRLKELIELPLEGLKQMSNSHLCLWWARNRKEHQQLAPKLQRWLLGSLENI